MPFQVCYDVANGTMTHEQPAEDGRYPPEVNR